MLKPPVLQLIRMPCIGTACYDMQVECAAAANEKVIPCIVIAW
jgi:hypothetical protein